MKLGTFLSNLAKKSGVDTTQQSFIDLLAHDIDIPDAIATGIDTSLMNEEAAKVKFKTAHRTEALNGVDKVIEDLLTELAYGEDEVAEVKGERNTYEKVSKLVRSVKALEAKKAGSKGEAKDALEKKIEQLNAEIKASKQAFTDKEKEWQTTRDSDLTNFEIQKILLGKEYALPKEMDRDIVLSTAQTAINKALATKGYKIVRTDAGLSIVDKDGNKAFSDNHEAVEPASFIDGALAQNKLLKVNDQSQSGGGNNQQQIPGGGQGQGNAAIVSEIEGQLFK